MCTIAVSCFCLFFQCVPFHQILRLLVVRSWRKFWFESINIWANKCSSKVIQQTDYIIRNPEFTTLLEDLGRADICFNKLMLPNHFDGGLCQSTFFVTTLVQYVAINSLALFSYQIVLTEQPGNVSLYLQVTGVQSVFCLRTA